MFTRTDDENKTTEPDALKTVLRFVSDTFCRQYANIIVLGAILKLARTRLNSPSPLVAIYNFTNVRSRLGRVVRLFVDGIANIVYLYTIKTANLRTYRPKSYESVRYIESQVVFRIELLHKRRRSDFELRKFNFSPPPPDQKIEKRGRNCTGDIVSAERLAKRRPDELGDLT